MQLKTILNHVERHKSFVYQEARFAEGKTAIEIPVEPRANGRAFYSTCCDATAEQVIAWYASRWSIEVAFRDSKQHLGFEEPQGWSRKAALRTAPVAMLLYSLIVLWFAKEGHRQYKPLDCPWCTSKAEPPFADMLATLRRQTVRKKVLSMALR